MNWLPLNLKPPAVGMLAHRMKLELSTAETEVFREYDSVTTICLEAT